MRWGMRSGYGNECVNCDLDMKEKKQKLRQGPDHESLCTNPQGVPEVATVSSVAGSCCGHLGQHALVGFSAAGFRYPLPTPSQLCRKYPAMLRMYILPISEALKPKSTGIS